MTPETENEGRREGKKERGHSILSFFGKEKGEGREINVGGGTAGWACHLESRGKAKGSPVQRRQEGVFL